MPPDRDSTPVPFTVADRLDIQTVREMLENRATRWDRAAEWVESRKAVEKVIYAAWTGITVVVGWIVNYFFWHKR